MRTCAALDYYIADCIETASKSRSSSAWASFGTVAFSMIDTLRDFSIRFNFKTSSKLI